MHHNSILGKLHLCFDDVEEYFSMVINELQIRRSLLINNLILIVLLGSVLNLIVMVANDSKMPVYALEGEDITWVDKEQYIIFKNFNEVNYPLLSDIFRFPKLYFSVGDILIWIGIWALVGVMITMITKFGRRLKHGTHGNSKRRLELCNKS